MIQTASLLSVLVLSLAFSTCRAGPKSFDHSGWDRLLHQHVDEAGRVAYLDLQTQSAVAFGDYLAALAQARPESLASQERLAFWINAYNAGTILAVTEGFNAESLIARGKLFKFWKFTVAGKELSLDEIEHDILRRQFAEPRIHFAIVCASASCPPLRAEAYVGQRLDAQLDEQAHRFINDGTRNQFSRADNVVRLSQILDWFKGDFERDGSLLRFLSRYVAEPQTAAWLAATPKDGTAIEVKYLDYDWTLNAQPEQRPAREHRGAIPRRP